MLKTDLANGLRQRQYRANYVSKELVDSLADDQIIDCYITCSCCGEKQVETEQLPRIIADAKNIEKFFEVCDAIAKTKSHVANSLEDILKKKGF
jgi:hypothetical protein